MRLRILLPKVKPEAITAPTQCAYAGCGGKKFYLRKPRQQAVARYGVSGSAGASLSVSTLQTHLSGLSRRDQSSADGRLESKG